MCMPTSPKTHGDLAFATRGAGGLPIAAIDAGGLAFATRGAGGLTPAAIDTGGLAIATNYRAARAHNGLCELPVRIGSRLAD